MQPFEAEDYTGDGAVHTIAAILGLPAGCGKAKWFQITAIDVGTTPARVGSAHISATRGFPVPAGGGQFSPPIAELTNTYDLDAWCILVQSGDVVSIAGAI